MYNAHHITPHHTSHHHTTPSTTPAPFPPCHVLTPIVPSDVAQCPGSCLLHTGVKLLQTDDQGVEGPTVHHSLGQLRGVLSYGTKDKGSSLLVETLRR